MKIINLRDYYENYKQDYFVEVSDEIAALFLEFKNKEAAYRLRTYRHKAYYSLDREDGIENEAVYKPLMPNEIYEDKAVKKELYTAIFSLPEKQARRGYAHFILGIKKKDIARAEGVDEKAVRSSIKIGLLALKNILKNKI